MDRAPAPSRRKLNVWGMIPLLFLLVALVAVGWRAAGRRPSGALHPITAPRSSASPARALQPSLYRAL